MQLVQDRFGGSAQIALGRFVSIRDEALFMWWVYSTALIGAVIGFGLGWRVISRERRPSRSNDTLLSWTEQPVSVWRQDWKAALFITLHSASVVMLATLFLFDPSWRERNHSLFLLDATPYMSLAEQSRFHQTLYLLATCGLGLTWVVSGSILAFPVATQLIRPITISVVPTGVVRGPYLWTWDDLSHFGVYPRARLIRVYSRRTPEIACMAWQPPNEDVFHQAITLLEQHLPPGPPHIATPWYRRRSMLAGLLLFVITVPFVSGGVSVYTLAFTWAWLYYTFVTPLVLVLGGRVFRQV